MTTDRLDSLLASMELELRVLVVSLADSLRRDPVERKALAKTMMEVVLFLKGAGGTDEHCRNVALYFIIAKNAGLGRTHLPADLGAIMDDIAGAMHDAVSAPQSAANFQATPAQLVTRLQSLLADS